MAIAPAWSELSPPLSSSTTPIPPTANSQITFWRSGVSVRPPAVMVSITKVPESHPVTKKIRISAIATNEVICAKGNVPSSTNSCVSSVALASPGAWPAVISAMLESPKIVSQMIPSRLGAIIAPAMNSRTVRPSEMRAINMPTNGAQLIHHAQ